MKRVNGYMERWSATALVAAVSLIILFAGACRKWSHNGDLDGQWQVMEVSYSGVPVEFPDGERFYYNFYLSTVQLGVVGRRPHGLEGNLIYSGDNLNLIFPNVRDKGVEKKWMEKLVYWGVPESGEINARIRTLTSSRLVFEFDDVVVTCRKF